MRLAIAILALSLSLAALVSAISHRSKYVARLERMVESQGFRDRADYCILESRGFTVHVDGQTFTNATAVFYYDSGRLAVKRDDDSVTVFQSNWRMSPKYKP